MGGELDVPDGEVSLESVALGGGGDDDGSFCADPGEESLFRGNVVCGGDLLERFLEGSVGDLRERAGQPSRTREKSRRGQLRVWMYRGDEQGE